MTTELENQLTPGITGGTTTGVVDISRRAVGGLPAPQPNISQEIITDRGAKLFNEILHHHFLTAVQTVV